MVDENIRFREVQLPSELSAAGWYDGYFKYDGSIYAFLTSQGVPPNIFRARPQRHTDTYPGTCDWVWDMIHDFGATHPAAFRALLIWGQDGYGGMSLVEFLNAMVPQ